MDQELRRYYEDRMTMMASKAWSDFIEDVEKMHEATNDLSSIQDEKTLHFRRGELSIMKWLLNLKGSSEAVFNQLKD